MADRAVPNLPSRDFAATVDYYGAFGFDETFHDDGWLILARGGLQPGFCPMPEPGPATSSFMCSIRVDDLEGLRSAVVAAGVRQSSIGIPRITPIAMQSWGLRAAFLVDRDGTLLHLIENPRA